MEAARCRESVGILEVIEPHTLDPEFRTTREAVLTWARETYPAPATCWQAACRKRAASTRCSRASSPTWPTSLSGDNEGMLETGRSLSELRLPMPAAPPASATVSSPSPWRNAGDYSDADLLRRAAMSVNPDDVYALHAKVHVQQRLRDYEGAKASISRYPNGWGAAEPMRIHMWWHFAMGLIGEGELDEALRCTSWRSAARPGREPGRTSTRSPCCGGWRCWAGRTSPRFWRPSG